MTKRSIKTKGLFHGDKILWAGLVFFSIPVLILAIILLQSSLGTGKVIEGNRFKNDLDPKITSSLIQTTQEQLNAMANVEAATVTLKAATVMVEIQLESTVKNEDIPAITKTLTDIVNQTLPITTYFTATDTMKMYDLQVDVYTTVSKTDSKVVFHTILTKNANMLDWTIQDVSTAVNPTLAEELRAAMEAKNNPTETTVPSGGSETEAPATTQ